MNINEVLIKGYDILKTEKIETYMLDAQLLLCKVLNESKLYIIMNRMKELTGEQEKQFFLLIDERKTKKPMGYILKEVEFMGLDFYVDKGVLIPRPDTEILVEESINIIKEKSLINICDMCCGSGAIGISIASFVKDTKVQSFDISKEALRVTSKNIKRFSLSQRVSVEESNLFQLPLEKKQKFQMIVSNPPYIEEDVIPTLMEDVKEFEPHLALSGGRDGLEFYRQISIDSKELLEPKGYLCFEIGYNQEEEVKEIMYSNGFDKIYSLRDLAGNPRVVIGSLP